MMGSPNDGTILIPYSSHRIGVSSTKKWRTFVCFMQQLGCCPSFSWDGYPLIRFIDTISNKTAPEHVTLNMANLTPQYIDGMMANQEMEWSSKFWDSYRPSFFPFVLGNCFHLWFQVSLKMGCSAKRTCCTGLKLRNHQPDRWIRPKKSEPPQCLGELLFKVRPPVGCLGWALGDAS